MRCSFLFLIISSALFAQQQVIPPELDSKQKVIYEKLTKSVSAPCCSNSIPVAYHESGMALYLRDFIRDALMNGDSEEVLLAKLKTLTLGEDKLNVVFAVPEKNWLGMFVWLTPALAILLGSGLIVLLFISKRSIKTQAATDDQLIENYGDFIRSRATDAG